MTSVTLEKLCKHYGPVKAVNAIDVAIEDGEFVALLGPSGCGKTTTLRCIAGLEELSDGVIRFDGKVVSSRGGSLPPEHRQIGMVFQSYAVWPHMTVAENVAFGLKLKRSLSRAGINAQVAKALETVGLGNFASRGVHQLSGGQQQRVALARAIALEPRLLLFDEPLSNLDAKLREQMRMELRQLQQRLGITSIYVTHDQEEAMVIADRIVLMQSGSIAQIGTPADIYTNPASLFAASFVGAANVLPGTVIFGSDSTARVNLGCGLELDCAQSGIGVRSEADVLCRPEQLMLSLVKPDGANVFQALVEQTVFMGNSADVFLKHGPLELKARVSPAAHWPPGTALWVKIPPESVRLLPR
jgi:iron(III) transport system ATP-binding protein/putative spermidine/putrescine transport system ATP-binding protein